jgi:Asp-tRNA(Asn)/Glu-tRNA(Gln) amidotransferase A subunit family amidase
VTSLEIVEAHITRIRRVNPTLNAVVKDRFDGALREAAEADEKTASVHRDDLPVFHGIPFTAKDALACEGMPNTSGLWARRDFLAPEDATAVKRLKEAGAILLGVTNISELCMWMESRNKVWGTTNNPYDQIEGMLGEQGVMLFPSYPTVAPKHGVPLLVPFKWVYTGIFNVMEMPVTQVPMGLDERNIPLGVQVAATNKRDVLSIAVALELERAVGGWTPPPRFPLS